MCVLGRRENQREESERVQMSNHDKEKANVFIRKGITRSVTDTQTLDRNKETI